MSQNTASPQCLKKYDAFYFSGHLGLLLIVTNFIAIFNVIVITRYFKHLGGGQVFKLSKTLISIIHIVELSPRLVLYVDINYNVVWFSIYS